MTAWSDFREHAASDMRRGVSQSMQDITIAKLVVMQFVLTVVVLLGWLLPLSVFVAWVIFALLMIPATAWNAGWRARTSFGAVRKSN